MPDTLDMIKDHNASTIAMVEDSITNAINTLYQNTGLVADYVVIKTDFNTGLPIGAKLAAVRDPNWKKGGE